MLSNKTNKGIKDVRLNLGADDTKDLVKVVDIKHFQHPQRFFKTTEYDKLSQDQKSAEKGTELPLPMAFSAFGWCFTLMATMMMVFVLFLLIFLIYNTINKEGLFGWVKLPKGGVNCQNPNPNPNLNTTQRLGLTSK